jgi:hypothetical protein
MSNQITFNIPSIDSKKILKGCLVVGVGLFSFLLGNAISGAMKTSAIMAQQQKKQEAIQLAEQQIIEARNVLAPLEAKAVEEAKKRLQQRIASISEVVDQEYRFSYKKMINSTAVFGRYQRQQYMQEAEQLIDSGENLVALYDEACREGVKSYWTREPWIMPGYLAGRTDLSSQSSQTRLLINNSAFNSGCKL